MTMCSLYVFGILISLFFSTVRWLCKCTWVCICSGFRYVWKNLVILLVGCWAFCFPYGLQICACDDILVVLLSALFRDLPMCLMLSCESVLCNFLSWQQTCLSFGMPIPVNIALGFACFGHFLAFVVHRKYLSKRRMFLKCRIIQKRRFRQCRLFFIYLRCGKYRCTNLPSPATCALNHLQMHHEPFFSAHDDLRGGAGAAHVTRRKRGERELLKSLQELLANFESNDVNHKKPGKKKNNLLSALETTVERAKRNPRDLLASLQRIISLATDGKSVLMMMSHLPNLSSRRLLRICQKPHQRMVKRKQSALMDPRNNQLCLHPHHIDCGGHQLIQKLLPAYRWYALLLRVAQ